MQLVQGRI